MKTSLYLHGLGSSSASKKFTRLKIEFETKYQIDCPEWTETTDINTFLSNLVEKYKNEKSILIIGSSTGGNFGYQLTNMLRALNVQVKLILINPLLHINQRISNWPFPVSLEKYLYEILEVNDCSMILGTHDELINHQKIKIGENVAVKWIDDDHKVKHLEVLMEVIKGMLL